MAQEEKGLSKAIQQLKDGNQEGFVTLYSQTYKYVYSRAKCMFSDEQEAQDLVQEVYLAAYRNIGSLENEESVFAWLRTITFYQGTKMLKKKRKELLLSEENEGIFETIPDDEPEIEEDYMNKEDVEVIRECINRLSDEQKTVLLAYYYDNLKVDEIADVLSISVGTIKSRLYLARKNLQVHIEAEEKKRGYKLHSFGGVTLLLAIRKFLQTNMEVAGGAEEAIFAKVCQGLNFSAAQTAGAQRVVLEKEAEESAKQTGKGLLTKLGGLGTKKIALMTVGIITGTVIGIMAIGSWGQEHEGKEPDVNSASVQDITELQQWQVDYAKILFELICAPGDVQNAPMADSSFQERFTEYLSDLYVRSHSGMSAFPQGFPEMLFGIHDLDEDGEPELYIGFEDNQRSGESMYMFRPGDSIENCYVKKVDFDHSIVKQFVHSWTILSELQIDVSKEDMRFLQATERAQLDYIGCIGEENKKYQSFQYTTILFDEDDEVDHVFVNDECLAVCVGNIEASQGFAISEKVKEHMYFEKQSKILVYDMNEDAESLIIYELDDSGCSPQKSLRKYYYTDETSGRTITDEEYHKLYNECIEGGISLHTGVEYKDVSERLDRIEFSLAK